MTDTVKQQKPTIRYVDPRMNPNYALSIGGMRQTGTPGLVTPGGAPDTGVAAQQNAYTTDLTNFLRQIMGYGVDNAAAMGQSLGNMFARGIDPTQSQQLDTQYRMGLQQVNGQADQGGSSAAAQRAALGQQYSAGRANAGMQNQLQASNLFNQFMNTMGGVVQAYPQAEMAPGTTGEGANMFLQQLGVSNPQALTYRDPEYWKQNPTKRRA